MVRKKGDRFSFTIAFDVIVKDVDEMHIDPIQVIRREIKQTIVDNFHSEDGLAVRNVKIGVKKM